MPTQLNLLVLSGCICLTVALMEAWCLVAVRYLKLAFFVRAFRSSDYLLRSHIDFLLMTGLLFICYLMFVNLDAAPPTFVIGAMCIGSLLNPLAFLALAVKPDLPQTPRSVFGFIVSVSFVLTTIGYLGAVWYIASAALRDGAGAA